MDTIEKTGRTVEEAVQDALRELGVSRDEVEIDVVSEEQKSRFLGFRSQTEVRVRVTRKTATAGNEATTSEEPDDPADGDDLTESDSPAMSGSDEVRSGIPTAIEDLDEDGRRAHDVVEELLQQIGVDAALEIVRLDSNDLQVNIIGEDLGFLIGKHGQTLYSIQYLINTIINRPELESTTESGARPVRVLLDSGGYRERRLQTLQSIARNAASKARTRGRRVRLDPLPSHERRIIHMTLADDTSVKTFSEGRDPNRHVIIEPTAQPRPRVVDHDRTPGVAAPRPKRVSTWGRPRPARQPFDTRLFDDMFADPKSPPRKPPSGESDEQGPSKEESG